jgi:hypothetical protein
MRFLTSKNHGTMESFQCRLTFREAAGFKHLGARRNYNDFFICAAKIDALFDL